MTAPLDYYPTAEEVDAWCEDVLRRAQDADLKVSALEDAAYSFQLGVRHTGGVYLRVESEELGSFFCFWQRCASGRGPVLLHLPGYGAEMSAHPELVADGYNVLHINPLGYATPQGPDESKRRQDTWPVMPDTVRSLGKTGYVDWLAQAAAVSLWALEQEGVDKERFAFFGTSQGGGTCLLLASIFRDRGIRAVAADEPFLTDFALACGDEGLGVYTTASTVLDEIAKERPGDVPAAWRAVGFVDTVSHAHRLSMPTLLTAGAEDQTCPAATIQSLFEKLPGARSYTEMAGQAHGYTTPFLHLARAWFRLYV